MPINYFEFVALIIESYKQIEDTATQKRTFILIEDPVLEIW